MDDVLDALFQRCVNARSVNRLVPGSHKEMHSLLFELLVVKLGHQEFQNAISSEQKPLDMPTTSPDLPLFPAIERIRTSTSHAARARKELEPGIGLGDDTRVARGAIEQLVAVVNGNHERRIELVGRQLH